MVSDRLATSNDSADVNQFNSNLSESTTCQNALSILSANSKYAMLISQLLPEDIFDVRKFCIFAFLVFEKSC